MSHTVQTVANIHDECKDKGSFAEELVYWFTHICQDADTFDHIPYIQWIYLRIKHKDNLSLMTDDNVLFCSYKERSISSSTVFISELLVVKFSPKFSDSL